MRTESTLNENLSRTLRKPVAGEGGGGGALLGDGVREDAAEGCEHGCGHGTLARGTQLGDFARLFAAAVEPEAQYESKN